MKEVQQVKNAKVKVIKRSYINGAIVEEGTVIEDYTGGIGSNLEVVKVAAKK